MAGHCTNCGEPCPVCSQKADDFNLTSMPKDCRRLIGVALDKIGLNNDTHQSILIKGLLPYKDRSIIIESALRKFVAMPKPPRNVHYIIAIVRGNSLRKKDYLDSLPPMAEGYEDE